LLRDESLIDRAGRTDLDMNPIFIPNGFQRTFGELEPAEKNQLSHRARALEKLRAFLIVRPAQQKSDGDIQS
jgi:hypothetical protein